MQCAAETVALLADRGKKKEQTFIDEMRQAMQGNSMAFDDRMNKGMAKIEGKMDINMAFFEEHMPKKMAQMGRQLTRIW